MCQKAKKKKKRKKNFTTCHLSVIQLKGIGHQKTEVAIYTQKKAQAIQTHPDAGIVKKKRKGSA